MLSTLDTMDVASPPKNASSDLKKTPKGFRSPDHVFTLGIEEELQIIDPETRELRSYIQQILADGKIVLKEQIKPEMHQSIVEIGTEICSDARDARRQITALRTELARLAAQHGLVIASAGTHPFSHWMDQLITVNERYTTVVNDMQQVARVCLTFGLHVHVGIPDREEAIDIMNQARYFLPHLYALSVNSPFWLGQNTGLMPAASTRPQGQEEELIRGLVALRHEVVHCPLLEVEPLGDEPVDVSGYDWVIVTSVNGASELRRRMTGAPLAGCASAVRPRTPSAAPTSCRPSPPRKGCSRRCPTRPDSVLFAGAEGARRLLIDELGADFVAAVPHAGAGRRSKPRTKTSSCSRRRRRRGRSAVSVPTSPRSASGR